MRKGMRTAHLVWTALPLAACSSTTFVHVAPLDPPAEIRREPISLHRAPLSPDMGRVVLDLVQGRASVVEEREAGGVRLACAATPCIDDVAPGAHRYWLIPQDGVVEIGQDGVVLSKDGVYPAPTEARVEVERGTTRNLRASLGRTEVHRTIPPGRAIGWTLFATGLAIAILGVATGASAARGSPDGETAIGLAELGVGVLTLGGALFLSSLNDNVTVRDHPGRARQWIAP